jgi:hypothetical protein
MKPDLIFLRGGLLTLALVALNACSVPLQPDGRAPTYDGQTRRASERPMASVTLVEGGLLRSDSGAAEIGLTLANPSGQTLWVSAHFKTPSGGEDCLLRTELKPRGSHAFFCPQTTVRARTKYPIHLKIFDGPDQSEPFETIDTSFRFSDADVQALRR